MHPRRFGNILLVNNLYPQTDEKDVKLLKGNFVQNKIQNSKTHTVLYSNFQELHTIDDLDAAVLDYARLYFVTGEFMAILEKTPKINAI